MTKPVLFSITQASALLRKDKAAVSRMAARGAFGFGHVDPGQKRRRFHLAAIEAAAGNAFSAEQVETALGAHVYTGPTKAKVTAAIRRRILSRILKHRDALWTAALKAQGVKKFTPPAFPNIEGKSK